MIVNTSQEYINWSSTYLLVTSERDIFTEGNIFKCKYKSYIFIACYIFASYEFYIVFNISYF